jgi:hypothetical protein
MSVEPTIENGRTASVVALATGSVAEMTFAQWVSAPTPEAVAYFAAKTGIDTERQRKLARILETERADRKSPPRNADL